MVDRVPYFPFRTRRSPRLLRPLHNTTALLSAPPCPHGSGLGRSMCPLVGSPTSSHRQEQPKRTTLGPWPPRVPSSALIPPSHVYGRSSIHHPTLEHSIDQHVLYFPLESLTPTFPPCRTLLPIVNISWILLLSTSGVHAGFRPER